MSPLLRQTQTASLILKLSASWISCVMSAFLTMAAAPAALKDAVLLDTCRKLKLISDTTYKKLKHILDMRNDIGISPRPTIISTLSSC
ncbi:hypothetical protein Bind_1498 [Beijerinckia indica subsp. indica ATCC 9039]|uniref:Uncharacterized protein n=1 Tax=Beijerinckia indica subsp. indica (strain ATCC 9039 / DSM 1715 / NCIMB 8712) TaxID=395963 RepID=B2IKU3_BEII9|nr:hypothetical protein Bind_1498 [Beijerinckia indica subsp. indica ATCC 9039]